MKIAIATKSMILGYGIDEVVSILSRELMKTGHEVTILTTEFKFPLSDSYTNIRRLEPTRLSSLNDYWQRHFLTDLRSMNCYLKVIKSHDILLTCDPMHIIGAAAKARFKKPVIAYFFGITPHNILCTLDRKLEFFRQTITWNLSFHLADYLMANSEYTKSMLPGSLRKKALVNYHGVEHLMGNKNAVRRFRRQMGIDGKKIVLSIGRFSTPYKGMKEIAKMFGRLRKRDEVVLLLVGGGTIPEGMLKLDSPENVLLLPNTPYNTLRLCLASCDVYCTASKWEGFDLPLVAAQANQKPVVAYHLGAHPEVVANEKTGFLVKDSEEFVNRLELLLDNDSLRLEMGKEAGEFARKFSWSRSMRKLQMLIESLEM